MLGFLGKLKLNNNMNLWLVVPEFSQCTSAISWRVMLLLPLPWPLFIRIQCCMLSGACIPEQAMPERPRTQDPGHAMQLQLHMFVCRITLCRGVASIGQNSLPVHLAKGENGLCSSAIL